MSNYNIVDGGRFCEELVAANLPIKLSSNPFDSEKDGVFTEDGPWYKKGDYAEIKKSNTWLRDLTVTTVFKGSDACNTKKCTNGTTHVLVVNYQTAIKGYKHPYAEKYWNVVRILRVLNPSKYTIKEAAIFVRGEPTGEVRKSICWSIEDNTEVVAHKLDPKLANKLRGTSNAT